LIDFGRFDMYGIDSVRLDINPRGAVKPGEDLGIGISSDRCWLTWLSNRVLWLPPDFRPVCAVISGETVALGCQTGNVVIMRFSPQKLPSLYASLSDPDGCYNLHARSSSTNLSKNLARVEHLKIDEKSAQEKASPALVTPIDVVVLYVMLSRASKLPRAVLWTILEYAEYWAHSSSEMDFGSVAAVGHSMGNQLLVRLPL
jgi:hypothetical protein